MIRFDATSSWGGRQQFHWWQSVVGAPCNEELYALRAALGDTTGLLFLEREGDEQSPSEACREIGAELQARRALAQSSRVVPELLCLLDPRQLALARAAAQLRGDSQTVRECEIVAQRRFQSVLRVARLDGRDLRFQTTTALLDVARTQARTAATARRALPDLDDRYDQLELLYTAMGRVRGLIAELQRRTFLLPDAVAGSGVQVSEQELGHLLTVLSPVELQGQLAELRRGALSAQVGPELERFVTRLERELDSR